MTIKSLITHHPTPPRPHISSAGAISLAPPPPCATRGLIGNHGADGESGKKKKQKKPIGFKREFRADDFCSMGHLHSSVKRGVGWGLRK